MRSLARFTIAAVPVIALVFGAVLVNFDRPRLAGIPFLLAWSILWALLAPVCLYGVDVLRERG